MTAAAALFRRELAVAWGGGGGPMLACAVHVCLATLLPLAVGAAPERLAAVAPSAAWAALALASLLSLERLFERDEEDGALDLLALGRVPLELSCALKAAAQWLATGLPLAIVAPVVSTALGAGPALIPLTAAAAALAALGFAFTGAAGAAVSLGAKRGGVLIAVVVLPLYAPPVIFAAGALTAASTGESPGPALLLLAAYALASVALAPFAAAAAVRNALG